jgi:hypothetical protein
MSETLSCFFDKDGNLINIGPWDYRETTDLDGNVILCNPLPEGAIEKDEEVVTNPDGSRSVVSPEL